MSHKPNPKKDVTVALIIDNEDIMRQVNAILNEKYATDNGLSHVKVLGEWQDFHVGYGMVRGARPTITIIGLCKNEDATAYQLAERVSGALPDTHICMIGPTKEPDIILRAMRAGVKDYISTPLEPEEIINVVERIKSHLNKKIDRPHLVGVGTLKGGNGSTTIAVNLAVALRVLTQKKVFLVDAVTHGGDVALFLNLKYHYTLKDVLENVSRLDSTLLHGYITEHPSGVKVIPAVELMDATNEPENIFLHRESLQTLFNFLNMEADFTVVDLGHVLSKSKIEALSLFDSILLVVVLELSALRSARQGLEILREMDLQDRVKIVVNRYSKYAEQGASAVTLKDVMKTLNMPIYCSIPNEYLAVLECINLGLPIVTEKRKSPVAQSFLTLAKLISTTSPATHLA